MNTKYKLHQGTLINFLLLVFKAALFLSAFAFIFYVAYGALGLFLGESNFLKEFPVMFSLDQIGELNSPYQNSSVVFSMHDGMGMITAEHLPKGFITLYYSIDFLQILCILFSLKFTVDILKAAKQKGFLINENAIRLRSIALLGIGMSVLEIVANIVSSNFFSDKLLYSGVEFTSINYYTFSNTPTILYSLFILVISEAFRQGALLKQEADLTI